MQTLIQDIRYATRNLLRTPGFTAVVVLTLALGIGANTSIFSIVNGVVLRDLAYPQPQQLVRITGELTKLGAPDVGIAPLELFDYQSRTDLFSGVAGLYPINANVTGTGEPERVEVMLATWNYFSILGGVPALGRVFGPEDNGPGIPEVAVVSDGYWRRRLGADRNVLGKKLVVDGDPFVIVGVMPPAFHHPGRTVETEVDVWSPAGYRSMPFGEPNRVSRFMPGAIARLQPNVTIEAARAALLNYGDTTRAEHPADYPERSGWRPNIMTLQSDVVGSVTQPMLILLVAVALVLLIVCANVAHLVLARSSERQQEIAIRQALGASAGRLARQMLTESAVLATSGGALGLLAASWGVNALVKLAPSRVPRLSEVGLDGSAVAITALLVVITTLLFGMAPAWQMRRNSMFALVKEGGLGRSAGRDRAKRRGLLVSAEVALAMILLVGAGLLIRSVAGLLNVPLGFDTSNVMTARIWLPRPNDPANGVYLDPGKRVAFTRELLRRASAIPGVEHAAMSTQIPLGGYNAPVFFEAEGRALDPSSVRPVIQNFQVSPGFFDTLKIPIVRGRAFNEFDTAETDRVIVISASAAQSIWGADDPIGKRMRFSARAPWMTIVGVAGDVRNRRLGEAPTPILYQSLEQSSNLSLSLIVRTAAGVTGMNAALSRELRAIDPDLPLYAARSMDELIDRSVSQNRFFMRVLVAFGVAAVFLALLGIYGVISYSVAQRTREIGIRIAIGASQRSVYALVVQQGIAYAVIGIVTGAVGAVGLTQLIKSQLFGVNPFDPVTLGAVLAVMTCVTLAACVLPARRAARVDPIIALRRE